MSIPKRVTVTCPKCGKPFQVTVFESVNTDYAEDIAQQIISGELFDAKCPSCGFVAHLQYDVLYHDMKHGAMIWLVHQDEKFEKKVEEIRQTNLLSYKTTRIVTDVNSLREKVACLEKNRDDRVIEILKLLALAQANPATEDDRELFAFYTLAKDKQTEIVFIYGGGEEPLHTYVNESNYEKIRDGFADGFAKLQNEWYPIVDSDWALAFLRNNSDLGNNEGEDNQSAEDVEISDVPTEIRFCRKCGVKLLENALFCHRCGVKVLVEKKVSQFAYV